MLTNYFGTADALPLAARGAGTANGRAVEVAAYNHLLAYLHATVVDGAGTTLDVKLQDSPDGTTWHDTGDSFPQVNAPTSARVEAGPVGRYVRAVATIANGAAVAATLTTALAGANNDLVYTAATAGAAGNGITVEYADPAAPSSALAVAVTGTVIEVSLATDAGAVATGSVTSTANGNPADADTVTIGAVTYTFRAALSAPAVANEVLIGADGNATLTNLKAALNASGTPGTEYSEGTVAHPDVEAPQNPGNFAPDWVLTVSARVVGAAGNALVLTESAANTTVSAGGTLSGGADVAITTTAADVAAAIAATPAAVALVSTANAAANDGTGVVPAMPATNLTGGENVTATFAVILNARH